MITNERQYRITRAQIQKFRSAAASRDELELVRSGVDPLIAAAHKEGLKQQLAELEAAAARYEALSTGAVENLVAASFREVGERLIEARIGRGYSQKELADRLGLKEQQIQRYEQERYAGASANRLAEVSEALEISLTVRIDLAPRAPASVEARSFDPARLPVREMAKRGWLAEFADEGANTRASAVERSAAYVAAYGGTDGVGVLHRKKVRVGSTLDEYALLAWKARILQKARGLKQAVGRYEPLDAAFVQELVGYSRDPEGPLRAVEALNEHGVVVVCEPHLKGTHMDGAAMLLEGEVPVIGLTLRYDRLDNFWFTLLHEVGHIVRHREQGLRDGFFDDNTGVSAERVEVEADEFAENALIPTEVWKSSFVRFTRDPEQVAQFAKRQGVAEAIVAGRIRRERGYNLFKDLIGSGCVRSLLADRI